MLLTQDQPFALGFTEITQEQGLHGSMAMDFGILQLAAGQDYTIAAGKERAVMILDGSVEVHCDSQQYQMSRSSLLDQNPHVLHADSQQPIMIRAKKDSQLAIQKISNKKEFSAVFYFPDDIRTDIFGKNGLQGTAARVVRTVFDGDSASYSNMVLGEVVNLPGRWSSYPPHRHPQPEIYHYRFFPSQGFGFGAVGDTAYLLKHRSTLLIAPFETHPQTAAPGYAMYYIWMIPHLHPSLPKARFGAQSREFVPEHEWLLATNADESIWTTDSN